MWMCVYTCAQAHRHTHTHTMYDVFVFMHMHMRYTHLYVGRQNSTYGIRQPAFLRLGLSLNLKHTSFIYTG